MSNIILRIIFGKNRDEMHTNELHSAANILTPWQQAHFGPARLLHKTVTTNMPPELAHDISNMLTFNERTISWQMTMDHKNEIGKLRLPNSGRVAVSSFPDNLMELKPACFSKLIRKIISDTIPSKPSTN